MTERERMDRGLLFDPMVDEITEKQVDCLKYLNEYNSLQFGDKRIDELLPKMFAQVGENCYIQPPFYANWGGAHVHLGDWVYANFNLTLVDDGNIFIGDNVMLAPNVTIATAGHPINPQLRERGIQYNADVHIGNNVWIGAGAIILPGVTIGCNTVIGAGSVVTKDIPENVVAVGSPCRVVREIGERDKQFYFKDKKIDIPIE